MDLFQDTVVANVNYWIYIILMMIGLFAMISKNNLVKKLVGMTVFQTAIILFYVSIGVKEDARIPILTKAEVNAGAHHATEGHGEESHDDKHQVSAADDLDPTKFTNPLVHVLMLTAIVVGVSTLGVALSLVQKIHSHYGSVEEDEILEQIRPGSDG